MSDERQGGRHGLLASCLLIWVPELAGWAREPNPAGIG